MAGGGAGPPGAGVSADSEALCEPLAGGVSSDIYRVDLSGGRSVCVKRALPKLKVAADWRAPVERNRWEVEWMRVAAGIVPRAVPPILGDDRATGCFAMAWLAPESHPVWKALLRDGDVGTAFAARVGDTLGRIHAATADRDDVRNSSPWSRPRAAPAGCWSTATSAPRTSCADRTDR